MLRHVALFRHRAECFILNASKAFKCKLNSVIVYNTFALIYSLDLDNEEKL